MTTSIRKVLLAAVLVCGLGGLPPSGMANSFPDKSVRLLVGYTPGGGTDIIARILAKSLSDMWGQQVIVENKPGASGMLAAEQVVRAPADGYTLILGYTPEVALNKLVFKEMRYDPIADLTPVSLVASAPLVLVTGPKRPIGTIKELSSLKGSADAVTYGAPARGGQQHMAGEMLAKLIDVPLTMVLYRGTAPAVVDLLGGQIDLFFATTPPLIQHIRAGKLKPIAVAGPTREKLIPDVPTMAEAGLPSLEIANWFGLFGPKNLPKESLAKLVDSVTKSLNSPEVTSALEAQGLTPTPMNGEKLRDFIASEMKKFSTILGDAGIAPQ